MDIGNFIKITDGKKAPAAPSPKAYKGPDKPKSQNINLSNKQLIGIAMILIGFVLIGIAIATW